MIQVLLRRFETNAVKSKLNRYVVEEVRQFRILSKAQNYFLFILVNIDINACVIRQNLLKYYYENRS